MRYKVFISAVQGEFQNERDEIFKYIKREPLLKEYFIPFIFEKLPDAKSKSAVEFYLDEVSKSNIFILFLGKKYGKIVSDNKSAIEKEYKEAKRNNLKIFVFIKSGIRNREPEVRNLIKDIQNNFIYKKFENIGNLRDCILNSLISFLKDKGKISKEPFDELINRNAAYDDINEKLVEDFLKNRAIKQELNIPSISIKDFLLKTIRVLKKEKNNLYPTNAAILFFCPNPQKFIPQSSIKIARYKGVSRAEFLDSKEISSSLYDIIDNAEKFFQRNTRLASKIVGSKRVEIMEYPFEAIREALVNAMAHRDYNRSGSNIQVDIFDDRVEVLSPGGLLPGLDIKNLEGIHETRNRKICEILHETKDMERYGTGIIKMKEFMKGHGLIPPDFIQPGDFFKVVFYGPGENILDLIPSIPEERQVNLEDHGLNERQIKALSLMVNKGEVITNRKYRELFKVSKKTAASDLKKLVEEGQIVQKGKGRNVRYYGK